MRLPALISAAFICMAGPASAEEDKTPPPLLELGIGAGGGYVPDYPAAGQNHVNGLALPYVIYRGKFLRAGDKAILRGRFISNDRVDLDISLDGSFAADSDKNDARRGMPDLDFLGEIGPRLQITLARAARDAKLDFELPLRAVFSTDFHSDASYRGFVLHPELAYQHGNIFDSGMALKLSVGPIFASTELMEYFYDVEPRYANAQRPAYESRPGYLGTRLSVRLARPIGDRFTVYALGNLGLHQGAVNDDSPLFREETTYALGLGFAWSFYHSDERGNR